MASDEVDELEKKLSKIFINLAKGERKTEISRQVLSENADYNPYLLFKLLDIENKNFITSTNIINYLNSKGIFINNLEAQLFILFYDQNYDRVLSYNEFLCCISNDISQKNYSQSNLKNDMISFNLDYSYTKLLEKEIELARKIIELLNDIKNNKCFNIHELYHKVMVTHFIDERGIKNFLDKNCEYFLDSDITAILKRLDLNKDGKVDLCEFHAFLGFPNCIICCPCMPCGQCKTCYCNSCFCNYQCNYHHRLHRSYNSPSKSKNNNDEKRIDYKMEMDNNYSNNNNNNNNFNGNSYDNINRNLNNDYQGDNEKENHNNNINLSGWDNCQGLTMKTKQILDNNYQFQNQPIVNENNNYNNRNEEIKEKNINNSEFDNNYNFDNNLNGTKISKTLSIRPSPERKDAPNTIKNNFFQSNHNNNSGIINNNIKLINPYDPYDDNQVNNKEKFKNNRNSRMYNMGKNNGGGYMKPNNQDEYEENQFNDFIKQIMLAESQIEDIKVNLSLRPDFNCEDCFRIFEVDGKGNLSNEDLKNGLQLIGVFASDFEIKLLFKRFDLQNRGFINYSDFFDIFVPFQKEFRTIVEERKPNSCCPCRCPDVFCPETISIMKQLMDTIIKHENNFNFLRRGFTTLNIKLKHIFENIDFLRLGYFTINDLITYLKKNNNYIDSLNTDLLFIRLDKNRNGKIDYKEIYDETHPLYL